MAQAKGTKPNPKVFAEVSRSEMLAGIRLASDKGKSIRSYPIAANTTVWIDVRDNSQVIAKVKQFRKSVQNLLAVNYAQEVKTAAANVEAL